jgi:hypothetical protein
MVSEIYFKNNDHSLTIVVYTVRKKNSTLLWDQFERVCQVVPFLTILVILLVLQLS